MAPSATSFDDMPQIERFPLPASNDVDWNKLGLQAFDLASHIESLYSAETGAWGEPRIVKSPYLQVHGLAPGLNYGQQCYEGLKACRTADNRILVFRPRNHAMRMQHSAQTVSIPPVPESHFLACVNILIASQTQFVPPHNSNTLLYIRPILFGSSAQLALTSPTEFTFAIFIQPGSAYHGVTGQDALVCENFDRTATHGTGDAKVGGNYAPVMKYTVAAQKEGFGLLLHLDSKTLSEIDEFSTSGFVGVKNDGGEREGKHTLVIPNSKTVIKSVTTDTIAELATSWGWSVERRAVKVDELPFFSEVLAVGTAALLLPIKSITRKSTGQKTVYLENQAAAGPCCQLLRSAIDDIFRGRMEGPAGWCVPVSPFKEVKVGKKQ